MASLFSHPLITYLFVLTLFAPGLGFPLAPSALPSLLSASSCRSRPFALVPPSFPLRPKGVAGSRNAGRVGLGVLMKASDLPRNIKETVSGVRNSLQQTLSNRRSRMEIELPYGVSLGIESSNTEVKPSGAGGLFTREEGQRSDRELARSLLEMFKGTELESSMVIAFAEAADARKATSKWTDIGFRGKVITLDPKEGKKKKKKARTGGAGGFGKKGPAEAEAAAPQLVPQGTEVLVVVGAQDKHLAALEALDQEAGMGCAIILANCRLPERTFTSEVQADYFRDTFEACYVLKPQPHPDHAAGVLLRAFPNEWTLALPRKIGPPRVLQSWDEMPTLEELDEAYKNGEAGTDNAEEGGAFAGLPNPFAMFDQK